jgi:hypothetical protein
MNPPPEPRRMSRRSAIKWMLSAAASMGVMRYASFAAGEDPAAPAKGYGTDPNLLKDYKPGDVWPLTFTREQRRAALALCDLILPADETSPKASDLGIHDFIDEWVSAPYPDQVRDRAIVLGGLAWIDAEAQRRHQSDFAALSSAQQEEICDAIADPATAKAEDAAASSFFKRYRDLTAGGYYTTPEGMKDIGYVGNVPLASYDGAPPEVLRRLGLD